MMFKSFQLHLAKDSTVLMAEIKSSKGVMQWKV